MSTHVRSSIYNFGYRLQNKYGTVVHFDRIKTMGAVQFYSPAYLRKSVEILTC